MFGLAWLTLVAFQTIRDVKVQHRAPLPSEYVASSAFFLLLALFAGSSENRARVATLVGWGIVIAIVLQAGGPAQLINNGAGGTVGKYLTPTPGQGGTGKGGGKKSGGGGTKGH